MAATHHQGPGRGGSGSRVGLALAVAALATALTALTAGTVGDRGHAAVPGSTVALPAAGAATGSDGPRSGPEARGRVVVVVADAGNDDAFTLALAEHLAELGYPVATAGPGDSPGAVAARVAAVVGDGAGAAGPDITVVGHGAGVAVALDLVEGTGRTSRPRGGTTTDEAAVGVDRLLLVSPDVTGTSRRGDLAAVTVPVTVADTGTGSALDTPAAGDGAALASRLPSLAEYLVFPDEGPDVVAALALLIDEAAAAAVR